MGVFDSWGNAKSAIPRAPSAPSAPKSFTPSPVFPQRLKPPKPPFGSLPVPGEVATPSLRPQTVAAPAGKLPALTSPPPRVNRAFLPGQIQPGDVGSTPFNTPFVTNDQRNRIMDRQSAKAVNLPAETAQIPGLTPPHPIPGINPPSQNRMELPPPPEQTTMDQFKSMLDRYDNNFIDAMKDPQFAKTYQLLRDQGQIPDLSSQFGSAATTPAVASKNTPAELIAESNRRKAESDRIRANSDAMQKANEAATSAMATHTVTSQLPLSEAGKKYLGGRQPQQWELAEMPWLLESGPLSSANTSQTQTATKPADRPGFKTVWNPATSMWDTELDQSGIPGLTVDTTQGQPGQFTSDPFAGMTTREMINLLVKANYLPGGQGGYTGFDIEDAARAYRRGGAVA